MEPPGYLVGCLVLKTIVSDSGAMQGCLYFEMVSRREPTPFLEEKPPWAAKI